MRPTQEQMKARFITPGSFDKLVRWGMIDSFGNSMRWHDWQKTNHNAQFEEPRERKQGKKKFTKEVK